MYPKSAKTMFFLKPTQSTLRTT